MSMCRWRWLIFGLLIFLIIVKVKKKNNKEVILAKLCAGGHPVWILQKGNILFTISHQTEHNIDMCALMYIDKKEGKLVSMNSWKTQRVALFFNSSPKH